MIDFKFKWLKDKDVYYWKYQEMAKYILDNYFYKSYDYDYYDTLNIASQITLTYFCYSAKIIDKIKDKYFNEFDDCDSLKLVYNIILSYFCNLAKIKKKYFIIVEILENINDYYTYKDEIHEYIKLKDYIELLENKNKNDEKRKEYILYIKLLRERYEISRLYINEKNRLQKYENFEIEPNDDLLLKLSMKIKDIENKIKQDIYYDKYVLELPKLDLELPKARYNVILP